MRNAGLAAVAVLTVMAAGCGGGGGSSKTYSLDTTSSCLRDHGYETHAAPPPKSDAGRMLSASTKKVQLGLIFHSSAAARPRSLSELTAITIRPCRSTF